RIDKTHRRGASLFDDLVRQRIVGMQHRGCIDRVSAAVQQLHLLDLVERAKFDFEQVGGILEQRSHKRLYQHLTAARQKEGQRAPPADQKQLVNQRRQSIHVI